MPGLFMMDAHEIASRVGMGSAAPGASSAQGLALPLDGTDPQAGALASQQILERLRAEVEAAPDVHRDACIALMKRVAHARNQMSRELFSPSDHPGHVADLPPLSPATSAPQPVAAQPSEGIDALAPLPPAPPPPSPPSRRTMQRQARSVYTAAALAAVIASAATVGLVRLTTSRASTTVAPTAPAPAIDEALAPLADAQRDLHDRLAAAEARLSETLDTLGTVTGRLDALAANDPSADVARAVELMAERQARDIQDLRADFLAQVQVSGTSGTSGTPSEPLADTPAPTPESPASVFSRPQPEVPLPPMTLPAAADRFPIPEGMFRHPMRVEVRGGLAYIFDVRRMRIFDLRTGQWASNEIGVIDFCLFGPRHFRTLVPGQKTIRTYEASSPPQVQGVTDELPVPADYFLTRDKHRWDAAARQFAYLTNETPARVLVYDLYDDVVRREVSIHGGEQTEHHNRFPAITPDGRMIAVGDAENARLVDLRTGATHLALPRVDTPWDGVYARRFFFSPNNRYLVSHAGEWTDGSGAGPMELFDIRSGERLWRFDASRFSTGSFSSAEFSPDSRRLWVGMSDQMLELDATTGDLIGRYRMEARVWAFDVGSDGEVLVLLALTRDTPESLGRSGPMLVRLRPDALPPATR
ncbi:MAG: WD40 repeat domain-containing protein [Planctomycetota bacterium]